TEPRKQLAEYSPLRLEQRERQQNLAAPRFCCKRDIGPPELGIQGRSRPAQARIQHEHERELLALCMGGCKIDRVIYGGRGIRGELMAQRNDRMLQTRAGEELAEDEVAQAAIAEAVQARCVKHADATGSCCTIRSPPSPCRCISGKLARSFAQQRGVFAFTAR